MKKKLSSFDMIAEMHSDIKQIKEELIPKMKIDISDLKVRSGMWSTVTGLLGGVFAIVTLKLWK
jgi:hypothetical protein